MRLILCTVCSLKWNVLLSINLKELFKGVFSIKVKHTSRIIKVKFYCAPLKKVFWQIRKVYFYLLSRGCHILVIYKVKLKYEPTIFDVAICKARRNVTIGVFFMPNMRHLKISTYVTFNAFGSFLQIKFQKGNCDKLSSHDKNPMK